MEGCKEAVRNDYIFEIPWLDKENAIQLTVPDVDDDRAGG